MGDKYINSETDLFENLVIDPPGRFDAESKVKAGRDRIPIVAYFHSQRRGFANSGELNDWLSDERKHDTAD